MDVKIKSVLIGIFVGWLLSQATDVIKNRYERKRKIKAIYTELADLSKWLDRMLLTTKMTMQLALLKSIVTNVPPKLHKFLLDEYFHEICVYLPREARIGITDCYGHIDVINTLITQVEVILDDPTKISNKELIMKSEAIYVNAAEAKFKIDFLIKNKSGDFELLKGVASELSGNITKELLSIRDEALNSTAEELNAKYYKE